MTRTLRPYHGDPTLPAVEFLMVPGRAEKVLAVHYARPDGQCSACRCHPARWPCSVASMARTAMSRRRWGVS